MNKFTTLLAAAVIAGCTSTPATVPWNIACAEQAATYCDVIGFADSGCAIVYTANVCHPWPAEVAGDDQSACIEDLLDMQNGVLPDKCALMWAYRTTTG